MGHDVINDGDILDGKRLHLGMGIPYSKALTQVDISDIRDFLTKISKGEMDGRMFAIHLRNTLDGSLNRFEMENNPLPTGMREVFERAKNRIDAALSSASEGGRGLTVQETVNIIGRLGNETLSVINPGQKMPDTSAYTADFLTELGIDKIEAKSLAHGIHYFSLMTAMHGAPLSAREAFARNAQADWESQAEARSIRERYTLLDLRSSLSGSSLKNNGHMDGHEFTDLIETTRKNFLERYGNDVPEGAGRAFDRATYRARAAMSPQLEGGENVTGHEAAFIIGALGNELRDIIDPAFTPHKNILDAELSRLDDAGIKDDGESAAGLCFLSHLDEKLATQQPKQATVTATVAPARTI